MQVIGFAEGKDLEDGKKLSAYFGIVPRVSDSNETKQQGRITNKGTR